MNTTHPDPVAAKKLREAIHQILREDDLIRGYRIPTVDKLLAALTPHLPALTQLPVAGEAKPDFEAAIREAVAVGLIPRMVFLDQGAELRAKVMQVVQAATPPSAPTNVDAATESVLSALTPMLPGTGAKERPQWESMDDADLNRHFSRAFWNRPIDERNNTYWHDDDKTPDEENHEWKPLPDFCNDLSAVKKLLLESKYVLPIHHGVPLDKRSRCRRMMVDMLILDRCSRRAPTAPHDAVPNAGAELKTICEKVAHDAYTRQLSAAPAPDVLEYASYLQTMFAPLLATPPAGDESAPPQPATNDATPGATGSQHVGNGVTAPSSWAVEAAKEIILNAWDWEISTNDVAAIIARHAQSAGDGKDRERLDWWEKNPSRIVFSKGYHGSPDSWSWFDARGNSNAAPTLRAALDKAMAQEGKP